MTKRNERRPDEVGYAPALYLIGLGALLIGVGEYLRRGPR